jgi:drug/metabolite transporter (DMT)-like permease
LGIIVIGLLIMGVGNLLHTPGPKPHLRDILLAFVLAIFISIYSTIDGAAVKHTAPFPYTILVFFLAPVFTAPWMFISFGWQTLKNQWLDHHIRLISIGLLSVVAYLLVLSAYSISLVSYSGAIREVSVVLGAFAGWKLLGERLGVLRVVGAVIIFIGILVVATAG